MMVTVNQQNIYIDVVWSMPHKAKRSMLIRTPARSVDVRRILDAQPFPRLSTFPISQTPTCIHFLASFGRRARPVEHERFRPPLNYTTAQAHDNAAVHRKISILKKVQQDSAGQGRTSRLICGS